MSISYHDDIGQAFKTIEKKLNEDERILPQTSINIVVSELANSSVKIRIRTWVNAGDFSPVKGDVSRKFKEVLEEESVSIPFPQRDIHIIQSNASSI